MVNFKHNLKIQISFILFFIIFLLTSCKTVKIVPKKERLGSRILQMSLEEKVGQLFVIRPDSIDPSISPSDIEKNYDSGVTYVSPAMEDFYKKYPAGGFVLFQKNIKTPQQVKDFNAQLHSLGAIRPLTFVDEEGGVVARLANTKGFNLPKFKNMGELGAAGDADSVYKTGQAIGEYLHLFGFDVDFAPVADVNTNPKNPVIGTRAFSSDPKLAGKMVSAFMQGLNSAGVQGCLKHYPGHGDTKTDTHKGGAETTKDWNSLKSCELYPFSQGIEDGASMIMAAHISVPKVDPSNVPATLSYVLLTEKLRAELKFSGLIITDAMEMKAITNVYSDGEAAVLAINAGADLILMPYDYRKAFEAVLEAVENGKILESRIDESVARILVFKERIK